MVKPPYNYGNFMKIYNELVELRAAKPKPKPKKKVTPKEVIID